MLESGGRLWFKKFLEVRNVMVQLIESAPTGLGIPDVFFRTATTDAWAELKRLDESFVKHDAIRVPFRPRQYEWLMDYDAHGGCALLILFTEDELGDSFATAYRGPNIKKYYTMETFMSLCTVSKALSEWDGDDLYKLTE